MNGSFGLLLAASVLIFPAVAGLNLLGWEKFSRLSAGILSTAGALTSSLLTWFLFYRAEFPLHFSAGNWLKWQDYQINFDLHITHAEAYYLAVATIFIFLLHIFLLHFSKSELHFKKTILALDFFSFSLLVAASAGNIFLLLAGWIGLGLFLYLPGGSRQTHPQNTWDGCIPFQFQLTGDFILWLGTLIVLASSLEVQTGTMSINFNGAATLAGILFLAGFIIKSGQFPLLFWPLKLRSLSLFIITVTCVLQGPATVYIFHRLNFRPGNLPQLLTTLQYLGAITVLTGALLAAVRRNYLEIIIFSTISQLGWLTVGVGRESLLISHLILVAGGNFLMLAASAALPVKNRTEIDIFTGKKTAIFSIPGIFILLGALAISGLPLPGYWGLSGARSEIMLEFFDKNPGDWIIYGLLLAGLFLTGFYIFRLIFNLLKRDEEFENQSFQRLPLLLLTLVATLAVLAGNLFYGLATSGPVFTFTADLLHSGPHLFQAVSLLAGIILAYIFYLTDFCHLKSFELLHSSVSSLLLLPEKSFDFCCSRVPKIIGQFIGLLEELVEKIFFNGLIALAGAAVVISSEFLNLAEEDNHKIFDFKKVVVFIIFFLIFLYWITVQ